MRAELTDRQLQLTTGIVKLSYWQHGRVAERFDHGKPVVRLIETNSGLNRGWTVFYFEYRDLKMKTVKYERVLDYDTGMEKVYA